MTLPCSIHKFEWFCRQEFSTTSKLLGRCRLQSTQSMLRGSNDSIDSTLAALPAVISGAGQSRARACYCHHFCAACCSANHVWGMKA